MRKILWLAASLIATAAFAFAWGQASSLRLTSSAFKNGEPIPASHTCDGGGDSESLQWEGAPSGTKSFALIMFDPDARPPRGFVHWVVYDLPASRHEIASGKYHDAELPGGGVEGNNGRGALGFIPSCPGPGTPHHYTFTLYALSAPSLGLPAGATRDQVLEAMKGKILTQTDLVGTYTRAPKP